VKQELMHHKPAEQIAEESLVMMASAGDMHAFDRLAAGWKSRIYNFALRYLGDHDEAMEASQQTFIKAWQRMDSLKEGAQFRAWLYVIAGNTCRDALRKTARSRTEPIGMPGEHHHQAEAAHPGERLVRQDLQRVLKQALAQLPEEQRVVLILKEYEELKFSEIAQILQEPESTVKSRLYQALKTMRRLLQPYQQGI
jgi:RNA polymerase sigma-70 factor (ECF subfamily)